MSKAINNHIFEEEQKIRTKNLELTIYHTKKAYLFYVEFIGQIREDNNSYLQLNSKDARSILLENILNQMNH